jgi:DNA-binding NarL/FixJ family response regulator
VTASVLVVDDNADYRLLVRMALARRQLFSVVAESSRRSEGVDLAARLRPDVVLVDLALSGTQGLTTMRAIQEAAPHAAVVGVSAYPESELRSLPRGGSLGYLSKDVPPSRLSDELALVAGMLEAVETARTTTLAADLSSPRAARRFVDDTLAGWETSEVLDTAELLVSEVVTNAVVHGHSDAQVSVRLLRDRVRVEVVDNAPVPIRQPRHQPDATSGRGTALVEALSSAWGIEVLAGGKKVWFELQRPIR